MTTTVVRQYPLMSLCARLSVASSVMNFRRRWRHRNTALSTARAVKMKYMRVLLAYKLRLMKCSFDVVSYKNDVQYSAKAVGKIGLNIR